MISQQKEQILEQGLNSLVQDGVRFFTVEALAQKLGMSKKTIYKYFPTKEVLLERITDLFTGIVERKFRSIIDSDEDPLLKFMQVMKFIRNHVDRFSIERIAEIKIRYPAIWKKIETFRLARINDFHTILLEAQEKGYIKQDLDVRVVAILYMNIINSTFQPEFFMANNLAPADTLKIFVQIVTEGLFTEKRLLSTDKLKDNI